MDWNQAQSRIRARIKPGTDLNTLASTYRFVQAVDVTIDSGRYGYNREQGFVISIGQSNEIKIPWSILRACFLQLYEPGGYNGSFFRQRFPLQAYDHPCHVHAIGMLFVVAGIARAEGRKYLALDA